MKKLPEDYKIRQERIIKKRLRRENTHRHSRSSKLPVSANFLGRQSVSAPDNLSLTIDSSSATIDFIRKIWNRTNGGNKVLIRFDGTSRFSAGAAVYLYSEIELIIEKYGKNVVRIALFGVEGQVRWLLKESGLLLLANRNFKPAGKILPIICGQNLEKIDLIVGYLLHDAKLNKQIKFVSVDEVENLLFRAISESMLNVKQHAYPDRSDNKVWWLTAAIIQEVLYIVLCDRGVGIPKTLPKQGFFQKLHLKDANDAVMIKSAMEYARTQHSASGNRGLGSGDIQKLIQQHDNGYLVIISGKGFYHLTNNTAEEKTRILSYNVGGTVIQWAIPLQNVGGS